MPRTTRSICTPAALASYSFSMMIGSTSELSLAQTPDAFPAFAEAISASIRRMSGHICCGEMTRSFRFRGSR